MDYLETVQKMFYEQRIGTVYGCFEVIGIRYDPEIRKQVWTMRCVHCGKIKETHNGKDYIKGKNHGTCQCQHVKKSPPAKNPKKEKRVFMKDHELYGRWEGIKARCYRKSDPNYENYGGRGIKMCDEWKNDFWTFARWAESHGYRKELTIERIDVNGDYCPENCEWIERRFQNKNKRNIKLYDGMTLPDYCDAHSLAYIPILKRIEKGMGLEEAIADHKRFEQTKEFNRKCRARGLQPWTVKARMADGCSFEQATGRNFGRYCLNGEYKTLAEWAREYGFTVPAIQYRMKKRGMTLEQALTAPKEPGRPVKNKKY